MVLNLDRQEMAGAQLAKWDHVGFDFVFRFLHLMPYPVSYIYQVLKTLWQSRLAFISGAVRPRAPPTVAVWTLKPFTPLLLRPKGSQGSQGCQKIRIFFTNKSVELLR